MEVHKVPSRQRRQGQVSWETGIQRSRVPRRKGEKSILSCKTNTGWLLGLGVSGTEAESPPSQLALQD